MWWFLVLLGVLIALAGLSVIALGVFLYVSTFGNSLITTGAVAASGGFVLTAMGLVLRQLERLSQQIERSYPAAEAPAEGTYPARVAGRGGQARLSADDQAAEPESIAAEPAPAALPPAEPRERIAAPSRTATLPPPGESDAETADPMLEARRQRLQRRAEPQPQPGVAPPAPPRPRTGYEPPPRPARPAPEQQPAPAVPPAPPPRREPEEPRILKSGIVGGMAYTLYSDGSIQADLPDGVVRFASLQELRDHVAQSQSER